MPDEQKNRLQGQDSGRKAVFKKISAFSDVQYRFANRRGVRFAF